MVEYTLDENFKVTWIACKIFYKKPFINYVKLILTIFDLPIFCVVFSRIFEISLLHRFFAQLIDFPKTDTLKKRVWE